MTRIARNLGFCLAVIAGSFAVLSAQTVQYVYDELGRLVAVVAPNGESAVYTYDAVGNLLSIARHGASAVTLVEVTPNGGPIGAGVTLYGTGFSPTPSLCPLDGTVRTLAFLVLGVSRSGWTCPPEGLSVSTAVASRACSALPRTSTSLS